MSRCIGQKRNSLIHTARDRFAKTEAIPCKWKRWLQACFTLMWNRLYLKKRGGGVGASCSVSLSVFGGQVAVVRPNPHNFDVADSAGTQAHSRKLRADISPRSWKGSFSVVHCTFCSIIFLFHSVQILSQDKGQLDTRFVFRRMSQPLKTTELLRYVVFAEYILSHDAV
jgi:hypothetical protein